MKLLSAFVAMMFATAVWAGPVTLKVDLVGDKNQEVHGKPTKSKKSGIPERVVTDTRQLEVTLSNTTTHELPGLNVVYYLFAKDVKDKDVLLVKKGTATVSLPSLGKNSFVSDSAVMTFHSLSAKAKDGKTETTPASGEKFYGYGVQVLSGNAVLAEVFDPNELKASTSLSETSASRDQAKSKKKSN